MHTNRTRRRGFSLRKLLIVVAILLVIGVVASLLIIGTIAVPKLNTATMNAREMAAVRQIQTIHTAQAQYMGQFGRFAASLAELGPSASSQPGPTGADLIGQDMATGIKNGYQFILQASTTGYSVNANPVNPGTTGRRTFFSDQTGIIRENWGQESANASSKEIK